MLRLVICACSSLSMISLLGCTVPNTAANSCTTKEDCPNDDVCEVASGKCIAPDEKVCDCTPEAPICGTDNTCRGCESGTECEALSSEAPICSAEATCVECESKAECSEDFLCSTSGTCVICEFNSDCADLDAPVCGEEATCTSCKRDEECDSGLCEEDAGRCVPEAEIVYVATNGSDAGSCGTKVEPCASLQKAVDQAGGARSNIFLAPGRYEGATTVTKTVQIVSHGDAELAGSTGVNQATLSFGPGYAESQVENVKVDGEVYGAIRCTGGNGLTLKRVHANNKGKVEHVLFTNGCPVNAEDSIFEKGSVGIACLAPLVLERSIVRGNWFAGIEINGDTQLFNNVIVNNGNVNPGSEAGAIAIYTKSFVEIAFNTIVGNQNEQDSVYSEGIACSGTTTVHHNVLSNGDSDVSFAGCTFHHNLFAHGNQPGEGNLVGNPLFVDAPAGDYHLQAESPAVDSGGDIATLDRDFDGTLRPQNGAFDMGAFELKASN